MFVLHSMIFFISLNFTNLQIELFFVLRGRLSVCDLIGFTFALNPNPREENRVKIFKFVNTVLSRFVFKL